MTKRERKKTNEDEQNGNFYIWFFATLRMVSGTYRVELAIVQ